MPLTFENKEDFKYNYKKNGVIRRKLDEGIPHYEKLSCGHQNNLQINGNSTGNCPKCLKKRNIVDTINKYWK